MGCVCSAFVANGRHANGMFVLKSEQWRHVRVVMVTSIRSYKFSVMFVYIVRVNVIL
jgi:hypothetical protein